MCVKQSHLQLLELPYEGDESSFLIVLPNEIDGLPALLEKLKDPAVLAKAVAEMNSVEVEVYLPKFKIETTTNLKDVLQAVCMNYLIHKNKIQKTSTKVSNSNILCTADNIRRL